MIGIPEISVLLHFFLFGYGLVIILLIIGWYSIRNRKEEKDNTSESFSILIPFRNEAEHLPFLLSSLRSQNFSAVLEKIVFVNDHSSDNSIEIIKKQSNSLPIKILELDKTKGKKEAIKLGWSKIKSPWILQLDADVVLPKTWFENICEISRSKKLTILPVQFTGDTFLQKLFAFEFMSISMMTFGSAGIGYPLMANGAHIFYRNEGLEEIFNSKRWLATTSGDDIAILEHYKENGSVQGQLAPDLKVSTKSEKGIRSLFKQRLRWAGKTSSNASVLSRTVALFMLFSNLMFLISAFKVFIYPAELPVPVFHIYFFGKLILDLFYLLPALSYFKKLHWMVYYPLLAFFYPFYVLLIAIFSFGKKGNWKSRPIKTN